MDTVLHHVHPRRPGRQGVRDVSQSVVARLAGLQVRVLVLRAVVAFVAGRQVRVRVVCAVLACVAGRQVRVRVVRAVVARALRVGR